MLTFVFCYIAAVTTFFAFWFGAARLNERYERTST